MPASVVVTLAAFRDAWPDLRDVSVVGLDLRPLELDWSDARVDHTLLLGCRVPDGVIDQLLARGVNVLPAIGGLAFEAYRSEMYGYDELTAVGEANSGASLDARIASWFASSSTSAPGAMVRAVHDATIDLAVARFVVDHRMVGIMGGHALARDAAAYRTVAQLGRLLTRAGYTVATGGGPGVMEAANLGAWLSPFADDALDDALAMLAPAPRYASDPDRYVQHALEVRRRWPAGGESLGVPTWVYADEPTGAFATHIAKYFTNSVRENGLLAIARSGVVYAAGGPGTEQEIFTDTAQNSLTLYSVRSPVVFFGRRYFEHDHPELVVAARRQAEAFGWPDLVAVCDEPDDVVAFVAAHDPDAAGAAGVETRRRHRDR